MSPPDQKADGIRRLNDEFRQAGPVPEQLGEWLVTRGISELGGWFLSRAIEAVATFSDFDSANDPHGEHDFGSFVVLGERCFWKVDYYDRMMKMGSSDPSDENVTTRVLTVMLASEY